jgi:hypothetical protein
MGSTRSDESRSIPTIGKETAIVIPTRSINIICILAVGSPLAFAASSS